MFEKFIRFLEWIGTRPKWLGLVFLNFLDTLRLGFNGAMDALVETAKDHPRITLALVGLILTFAVGRCTYSNCMEKCMREDSLPYCKRECTAEGFEASFFVLGVFADAMIED